MGRILCFSFVYVSVNAYLCTANPITKSTNSLTACLHLMKITYIPPVTCVVFLEMSDGLLLTTSSAPHPTLSVDETEGVWSGDVKSSVPTVPDLWE